MNRYQVNLRDLPRGVWGVSLLVLFILIMVGTLLIWFTQVRNQAFEDYHQKLMRSSVAGTAREIEVYIEELRRSVHLLADKESDLLRRLAESPEDVALNEMLSASVHHHFPEAFAFTVADHSGLPLLVDFDGLIGEVCQADMRDFAESREHSRVYVHPHPEVYHFDIMVDWELDGEYQGVFFISFPAKIISELLKRGQLPEHSLMLLKQDIDGLIEATIDGPRNQMRREFRLSLEEMGRIGYSTPVKGTAWDLVDIPGSRLFQAESTRNQNQALWIFLAIALVSVTMLSLYIRLQTRNQKLRYQYTHDDRTGFPNRYYLLERLQHRIHSKRLSKKPFVLLLVHLGRAKRLKGTFFDYTDDTRLLTESGNRIMSLFKQRAILALLGPNEFGVLVEGATADEAATVSENIRDILKRPLGEGKQAVFPDVRIGYSVFPKDGRDAETLSRCAGSALYHGGEFLQNK